MKKNNQFWLPLAVFWVFCTVFSSEILARALDMALAVSCVATYIQKNFSTNSTQKMWLNRFNVISLAAAALFLVLRVYYMFFA